ncbi:GPI inositol-deacylase isoform X2 [Bicyclus anynana]|uniref:GPI inositol-deacylase n=1 Tax=Bicyclus anynana TaxID=110368 RepID=A0ABM3LMR7_BICAN|nr:GPI inositol-deacylase isoform X2 [Bicyclus anynana]
MACMLTVKEDSQRDPGRCVNYNEELSGLYGGVLDSQTQFASACIKKILSLYKNNKYTKSVPTSIILIGHSMGGLIAKRLLAYPSTINVTSVAITLAAPLEAPVVNFDAIVNDYYILTELAWQREIHQHEEIKETKFLISIGSGPRDLLIPAGLTSSNDSYISALTTSIPGVWVSPDHVSIVWCKQLVMVINRFLFDIVDPLLEQVTENSLLIGAKARQYFEANRSMIINPRIKRNNVTMQADAFWYEDNRRIYQISRPEIDRTTHLMIRLVSFPQNRFVAVETVNVQDQDWIFGCNAKNVHNSYRYCKEAISLSELSRWTGSIPEFGKRKLATVNLHKLTDQRPDWTHVIVRVSPTNKPVTLNVDINDHASRQINVQLPSDYSFGKQMIITETEANSLYYELLLPDFGAIHQAYLLYVEPTASCQATSYHASAELHVPWAKNHEYYHYFTHLKKSPMKLRLYKSNPNILRGIESDEKVKITLLLDPQCTFSISISTSWYLRIAQLSRNYTPVLVPYVAAIILLVLRTNILKLKDNKDCISIHSALMSEGVKPYYAVVFGRLTTMVLMSVPLFAYIFVNASSQNMELQYFARSMLVLPAYMTALGILNVAALAVLAVMVFWSQLAHRLLFRIVWRGGPGLAERMASGLQKVPMLTSATLVCAVPLSCGAASLAAGAAFYAFLLSKMYEEYLEDYVYRLGSRLACRIFKMFISKKNTPKTEVNASVESTSENVNVRTNGDNNENINEIDTGETSEEARVSNKPEEPKDESDKKETKSNSDENLNNINFHMSLFFMWLIVTIVNVPALLTWAHNFKYSIILKPDTSYLIGIVMSACSAVIWQMNGPRKNLRNYDSVSTLLFSMAVLILALGPYTLFIVNYGIAFIFLVITVQQLYDIEEPVNEVNPDYLNDDVDEASSNLPGVNIADEDNENENEDDDFLLNDELNGEGPDDYDVCDENKMAYLLRSIREKFGFDEVN